MFALGQTSFDHNFSQDLDLQQIYGGGLGWTFLKKPTQEADLKATMQYEKQQFISGSSNNQNLIGSTFSANYLLKMKLVTYTQTAAFIPAYNNERAYSATETNTFVFPTYKNFALQRGDAGQLSERSAGDGSADETEFVPVHDGSDVRVQVEVLKRARSWELGAGSGSDASGLSLVRGGLADRLLEAAELAEMVAHVDDVKAPPLIRAQGSEHKVGGHALQAESLAALVEQSVHLVDLLAEEFEELGATGGLPVELIGSGKAGSRRAAGHVPKGEDDHLQSPLNRGAAVGGGAAALKAFGEDAAGAAAGEDEVLDELLGGPQTVVLKGVHLAPLGRRGGELGAPGVEDLLQDDMHRMAAGERGIRFVGTISIGEGRRQPRFDQSAPICFSALWISLAWGPLGRALR